MKEGQRGREDCLLFVKSVRNKIREICIIELGLSCVWLVIYSLLYLSSRMDSVETKQKKWGVCDSIGILLFSQRYPCLGSVNQKHPCSGPNKRSSGFFWVCSFFSFFFHFFLHPYVYTKSVRLRVPFDVNPSFDVFMILGKYTINKLTLHIINSHIRQFIPGFLEYYTYKPIRTVGLDNTVKMFPLWFSFKVPTCRSPSLLSTLD